MADETGELDIGPQFVEDGHLVYIVWDKDHVRISGVHCPNKDTISFCNRHRTFCVVERFVEVFGFDTNIGRTMINGPVEIAWMGVEGDGDIDDEWESIWICPVNDADYMALKALNADKDL